MDSVPTAKAIKIRITNSEETCLALKKKIVRKKPFVHFVQSSIVRTANTPLKVIHRVVENIRRKEKCSRRDSLHLEEIIFEK